MRKEMRGNAMGMQLAFLREKREGGHAKRQETVSYRTCFDRVAHKNAHLKLVDDAVECHGRVLLF